MSLSLRAGLLRVALACVMVALMGTAPAFASVVSGQRISGSGHVAKKKGKKKKKVSTPTVLVKCASTTVICHGTPGATGPAGAAGPAGPQGVAGPGARWALVSATGTIITQSGGITVTQHKSGGCGTGCYVLGFTSPVSGHAIIVSSNVSDLTGVGTISAAPCAGPDAQGFSCFAGSSDTSHVYVFVDVPANTNASGEEHSFYIVVI